MFRKLATITSSLLLLTGAWAAAVPEGVVNIQTTIGGAVNGRVQTEMSIRNDSPKTITALAWTVEGKYADGTIEDHSGTVDLINELLVPEKSELFLPGITRKIPDALPLGAKGEKPVSVSAHLTVVVFEDDTAIGDQVRIHRIEADRRSQARLVNEDLVALDAVLKDPSPKTAIRAAIAQHEAKGQHGGLLPQMRVLIEADTSPGDLEKIAKSFRSHHQLLMAHSKLEVK